MNDTKISCFVVGIIKGIKEKNNPYQHFGSLLAFEHHLSEAKNQGFVGNNNELTEKGLNFYRKYNLESFPDCRSYYWNNT